VLRVTHRVAVKTRGFRGAKVQVAKNFSHRLAVLLLALAKPSAFVGDAPEDQWVTISTDLRLLTKRAARCPHGQSTRWSLARIDCVRRRRGGRFVGALDNSSRRREMPHGFAIK
jgi:hypothetical protein